MSDIESFDDLAQELSDRPDLETGQMFGKRCIKVNGKAFCVEFDGDLVFKLDGEPHHKALSVDGAKLWDPSGKGRPMKQWVQVPASASQMWSEFGEASYAYLEQLTRGTSRT